MWIALVALLSLSLVVTAALLFLARSNRKRRTTRDLRGGPKPSLDDVRSLARAGRKLEAIRVFRQVTGQGIAEARAAVEQLSGRTSAQPRKQGIILRDVRDADIEGQIRSGHLLNAIALYREKNGVGLQEARSAVEAWRDRLRAS